MSDSGGKTWKQLWPLSHTRGFSGLQVDPTDSKRIFWGACGNGGAIWRTEDQGNTWKNVFAGENFVWDLHIAPNGVIYAFGLEVNPLDPKTIWISHINWGNTALGGIYKSTDSGTTWANITGDIPFVKPLVLRFDDKRAVCCWREPL